jgi:hypothetical protein
MLLFLPFIDFKIVSASLSTRITTVRVNLVNGSSGQGNGFIRAFSFLILLALSSGHQSSFVAPAPLSLMA